MSGAPLQQRAWYLIVCGIELSADFLSFPGAIDINEFNKFNEFRWVNLY